MSLPGDTNLPPGVTDKDTEGAPCPECGERGDCECESNHDQSYAERIAEEAAEQDADCDRDEGLI